jgi:altronate dehydratase large subunit
MGFARPTGRPGVRNHLLILSVCGLNGPGARKVAAALPDAVLVSSPYGRGHVGVDAAFQVLMLDGFATHPNVGAVLVIAPDAALRRRYQDVAEEAGRVAAGVSLQEAHEDGGALVREAVAAGHRLAAALRVERRVPCAVADLVLALECGHSDASSGITSNPLAGHLVDALVAAGGAAILSETMEWTGTEAALRARCASAEVAARLDALVEARHGILRAAGGDFRHGNPGPQNHDGGITTLEEKSLGAIAKGGSGPIVCVLGQGERIPRRSGLHLMDSPCLSPESMSSMVAGGAQVVIFTTGQGNPYGSAIAPTIKLTANPDTALRMPRQIDFDASSAFTGDVSTGDLAPALFDLMLAVAEGRPPSAEIARECDEVISRLGPSI